MMVVVVIVVGEVRGKDGRTRVRREGVPAAWSYYSTLPQHGQKAAATSTARPEVEEAHTKLTASVCAGACVRAKRRGTAPTNPSLRSSTRLRHSADRSKPQ